MTYLPRMDIPIMQVIRRVEPIRLHCKAKELESRFGVAKTEAVANRKEIEEARRLIDRVAGGAPPGRIDRKVANAVVQVFSELRSTPQQSAAIELITKRATVSWRRLWHVWQLCDPKDRQQVADVLAERLAPRCEKSKRFAARLPAWLPKSQSRMKDALVEPRMLVRADCETRGITLDEFQKEIHVPVSCDLGATTIAYLIRRANSTWWECQNSTGILDWAKNRPPVIREALSERLLVEHGKGVLHPQDLPKAPELLSWVNGNLGDPYQFPGRWENNSSRAKEVYDWLCLADQLEKILSEFRKHAEDQRYSFWAKYRDYIRDARYYEARDTAVCLMVIGNSLVIEFGKTGNACFVYRKPDNPLRSLKIGADKLADAFKVQEVGKTIRLGKERLSLRDPKLTHRGAWQERFRDKMAELDPQTGRIRWR